MDSYRYGFQNQEKDDELKGAGNSVNYKYRMHDPRVGRFFAVDPLASKYPFYSPYHFSSNSPINSIELEGKESNNILNFLEKVGMFAVSGIAALCSPISQAAFAEKLIPEVLKDKYDGTGIGECSAYLNSLTTMTYWTYAAVAGLKPIYALAGVGFGFGVGVAVLGVAKIVLIIEANIVKRRIESHHNEYYGNIEKVKINDNLIDLNHEKIGTNKKEIDLLKNNLESNNDGYSKLMSEFSNLSNSHFELKNKITNSNMGVNELSGLEIQSYTNELKNISQEISNIQSKISNLNRIDEKLKLDIKDLNSCNDKLQLEINSMVQENHKLRNENKKIKYEKDK